MSLLFLLCWIPFFQDAPLILVREDDTVIDRSCRIRFPEGVAIEDANGNGVLHVRASGITIELVTPLRGVREGAVSPDEYRGYGIRIEGQRDVTIRGAGVHGFHAGIWATGADGLTVEDLDASDQRRPRLRSTPAAEDTADWISPHRNDANEWLTNYGAAIYIEDSSGITVRRCRVRESQNGLCLDRVNGSKIYDNDFSFLSGWGIALWRSSGNVVSRNACDFCIRGYSHGVYNRGQDSAGILVFEQCSENVFSENSATHGGDGFFGFAGREALGEGDPQPAEWYRERGNNRNRLVANDFSYAAAHGIEMTFSFHNRFEQNRLVGNAICGIWGGYSQFTTITKNIISENGDRGYGLERGGVNIEHGRGNVIFGNEFSKNRCGVHLWWDPEGDFAKKPWGLANGTGSTANVIAGNQIIRDELAFQLRGPGDVTITGNHLMRVEREMEREPEHEVKTGPVDLGDAGELVYRVFGQTNPVGARAHLQGRQNIIMTPWGPWDHASPLMRLLSSRGKEHLYELRQFPDDVQVVLRGSGVTGAWKKKDGPERQYVVTANRSGVFPYELFFTGDPPHRTSGMLMSTSWKARFFQWPREIDPRKKLEEWRALAAEDDVVEVELDELRLPYGMAGPSERRLSPELDAAGLGGDHFGMIARTELPLFVGRWRFSTLSDDGVRVLVDGKPVIDNWTWHGPTRNEGTLDILRNRTVEIVVEHFEIDGYAVLELEIIPN